MIFHQNYVTKSFKLTESSEKLIIPEAENIKYSNIKFVIKSAFFVILSIWWKLPEFPPYTQDYDSGVSCVYEAIGICILLFTSAIIDKRNEPRIVASG